MAMPLLPGGGRPGRPFAAMLRAARDVASGTGRDAGPATVRHPARFRQPGAAPCCECRAARAAPGRKERVKRTEYLAAVTPQDAPPLTVVGLGSRLYRPSGEPEQA